MDTQFIKKNILFIEDDDYLERIYHSLLNKYFNFVIVSDKIEEIKGFIPIVDYCFIDIMLAGNKYNGMEMYEIIKDINPNTKYFFLTNASITYKSRIHNRYKLKVYDKPQYSKGISDIINGIK